MHHSDDISANTEFEYLKNIMFQVRRVICTIISFLLNYFFLVLMIYNIFQYLTNNVNSNSTTLIKVIAAVLKFSPQQTQVVLEKEAHRKTLVHYFIQGILLDIFIKYQIFLYFVTITRETSQVPI